MIGGPILGFVLGIASIMVEATNEIKPEAAGFSAVVYGHTHVPKQEVKNKVLYFNPGAAGPRRFKLPVSVGKLTVANGTIQGAITILDVAAQ